MRLPRGKAVLSALKRGARAEAVREGRDVLSAVLRALRTTPERYREVKRERKR